jgi:adenosylcobinamide-GDP ribazoletransferase
VSGLRSAVALLTRIPIAGAGRDGGPAARAVRWFPVVGAAIGLAVAGAYAGAALVLPSPVAAAIAVAAGVVLTGGFHEDGLADTAEAVGGSFDRDEAIRILRDPRLGTYGVLALVLSVVIRTTALASLTAAAAAALLPVAHGVSRAAVAGVLAAVRPAAEDGMGASYGRAVTRRDVVPALGFALILAGLALGPWAPAVAGLAVVAALVATRGPVRRLGGITGDVLGAVQQAVEVVVLVAGAALVERGWWSVPWWG